jgi:hypothetical protein
LVTFQATQPKSAYRHLFIFRKVPPIALTETSLRRGEWRRPGRRSPPPAEIRLSRTGFIVSGRCRVTQRRRTQTVCPRGERSRAGTALCQGRGTTSVPRGPSSPAPKERYRGRTGRGAGRKDTLGLPLATPRLTTRLHELDRRSASFAFSAPTSRITSSRKGYLDRAWRHRTVLECGTCD